MTSRPTDRLRIMLLGLAGALAAGGCGRPDPAEPRSIPEIPLGQAHLLFPPYTQHPWVGKTVTLVSGYTPPTGGQFCLEWNERRIPSDQATIAPCTFAANQRFRVLAGGGLRVQFEVPATNPPCLAAYGITPRLADTWCSHTDSTSFALPLPVIGISPPPTLGPITSLLPFGASWYDVAMPLPFVPNFVPLVPRTGASTQLWRFKEAGGGWL